MQSSSIWMWQTQIGHASLVYLNLDESFPLCLYEINDLIAFPIWLTWSLDLNVGR
jgi:hypothetical protein